MPYGQWNNPYNQYQTYQPYQYQSPFQNTQQSMRGPTTVNGPESALEFGRSMSPNSMSQALFDTSRLVFYIVSTDGAGTPSLETFDYQQHADTAPPAPSSQAISREEFDALVAKVNEMEANNGTNATPETAADNGATRTTSPYASHAVAASGNAGTAAQ